MPGSMSKSPLPTKKESTVIRKIIAITAGILAALGAAALATSGGGTAQAGPTTTTLPPVITYTTVQDPQTGELVPSLTLINPGSYFQIPVGLAFGARYDWRTQVKNKCPKDGTQTEEPWVDIVTVPDGQVVPMPWESQQNVIGSVRLLHAPYVYNYIGPAGNMRAHLWCTHKSTGQVNYLGSTGLIQLAPTP
jgi:hypothetical protein